MWLPLLVLAGASVLVGMSASALGARILFPFCSGPWLAVIVIISASMVKVASEGGFFMELPALSGVVTEVSIVATSKEFHQQPGAPRSSEPLSLPTLQTSTCNCVHYQQSQHMSREKSPAKAPAVARPIVPRRREFFASTAMGGGKCSSLKRVLARYLHEPP
jgi:hypothetical protein